MSQLVIVLSGRKQSGKTTSCNQIAALYLNNFVQTRFHYYASAGIDDTTLFYSVPGTSGVGRIWDNKELEQFGIKMYSFADPLKEFCVNVLGVPRESCYGTDQQKDSKVEHLLWDNVPLDTRQRLSNAGVDVPGVGKLYYSNERKSGPMTGREVMQWFGTDICRNLYGDCWAAGTYGQIKREGYRLALVTDGRFPNEMSLGSSVDAKSIRLSRAVKEDNHPSETALDGYPKDRYTVYLDNSQMSVDQQFKSIESIVMPWFKQSGFDHERCIDAKVPAAQTSGCSGTGACSSDIE
jgi:hypothetical protein